MPCHSYQPQPTWQEGKTPCWHCRHPKSDHVEGDGGKDGHWCQEWGCNCPNWEAYPDTRKN